MTMLALRPATPLPLPKATTPRARTSVVVTAKKPAAPKRRLDRTGYIDQDNSGRGNIFAVEPRSLYTSSPTAARAASQGLGGVQGLLVLAAVVALVAAGTLGVASNPGDTLEAVAARGEALDSLTALAARLSS